MPAVLHASGSPLEHRPATRMLDEPGVQLGLAQAALVLVTMTADLARTPQLVTFVLLGVAALLGSRHLTWKGALCLGLSAWAFWNGFAENRMGQLTLAPHDLALLVVPVVLASAGSSLSRRPR